MLKNKMIEEKPQKEELKERLDKVRNRLAVQQMAVKEHKLPVIVLVEGWGTAGKGSMIGKIINNIDPRFFKVASLERIREEDLRKPFLWRYFTEIPEAGNFVFMDSGWMEEVTRARAAGEMDDKTYESRIASIRHFERQLVDNGYLVVKFFLHISEKEQKKRIEGLHENEDTDQTLHQIQHQHIIDPTVKEAADHHRQQEEKTDGKTHTHGNRNTNHSLLKLLITKFLLQPQIKFAGLLLHFLRCQIRGAHQGFDTHNLGIKEIEHTPKKWFTFKRFG